MKQRSSRKLKERGEEHFWQRRYYDFNVWSEEKTAENLHYMHCNPVKRGLVAEPEDWPWSSFRHHATGQEGTVEMTGPVPIKGVRLAISPAVRPLYRRLRRLERAPS